jgi:hypothetical protein
MRDLIGYLKKTPWKFSLLKLISFVFFLFLIVGFSNFVRSAFAVDSTGNFEISVSFEHTLTEESVETDAILNIKSDSPRVISYYTATIPLEELKISCTDFKTNKTLECTTYNRGSSTDVLINLKNSVVRPEESLKILLKYSTPIREKSSYTLSSEIGDTVTESVLIIYSKEMGEPLWSSDPIHNIRGVGDNFQVLIDKPTYSNISLLFGERLLYKFEINKVFSNSLNEENQTFEIYVPSDTPTQTVIWQDISPLPNISLQDEDGNYIFKYVVEPDQTLDCNITGYIQKTESLATELQPSASLTQNLGYWSINDSTEFKRVNTYLQRKGLSVTNNFDNVDQLKAVEKELFYKYLYQYVIDRLNYDKEIPLGIGNQARLGANTLVDSPNKAGATDYADFYIALLRKYGVPARLAVGYISNITGYTSDGFYHHWVEYLDSNQSKWVTVDPFLDEYFEKDLFGSSFLDHIVILRRGKSPVAPKMTFFQENDFIVNAETQESFLPEFKVNSEFAFEEYKVTDKYLKAYIHISNIGNIAVNDYSILKSNISEITKYLDPVNNLRSQIILPKENSSLQFNIPYNEVHSRNLFVTAAFRNLDMYELEETLEAEVQEEVPIYVSLVSKLVSILIFGIFVFLIYFLITKGRKILLNKKILIKKK